MGMMAETKQAMSYRSEADQDVVGKDGKVLVEKLVQSAGECHTQSESEMDAFLAGELNQMSLAERQKVFEELHGVDSIIKETPEFVAKSLAELQDNIMKINPKEAYEMAEEISKDYVHDESFRLMFLRADWFDPVKAAKRLVVFFECRLALFGSSLLTRGLTIDDLGPDDFATLKSGYFQLLPSRDTSNRAVHVNVQGMFKRSYKSGLNMQRVLHYLFCTMSEDLETQVHGCVWVLYQIGSFEYDPPPDLFTKSGTNLTVQGSPVRLCGMHMCLEHPVMKAIARVVLALCGKETRARYRCHEGSHTEVQYGLSSFGIPVDLLPITSKSELKKGAHNKWLAMRKAKEIARGPHPQHQDDVRIDLPSRNDILMGKGKPVQEHAGNVAMRALVGLHIPKYNASAKHAKINFVKKVCATIRSSGGRFLKKDPNGWWVHAADEEVRDKLSKTFTSEQAKAKRSKTIQAVQKINSESFYLKRSREAEFNCFCDCSGSGDDFQIPKRRK